MVGEGLTPGVAQRREDGGGHLAYAGAPAARAPRGRGGCPPGQMYVIGGFRPDGSPTATVEAYAFTADRWQFVQPLPVALDHPRRRRPVAKCTCSGGLRAVQPWI